MIAFKFILIGIASVFCTAAVGFLIIWLTVKASDAIENK